MVAWLISLTLASVVCGAESLTVISPHWEGVKREYERAFNNWHQLHFGSAVNIEWRDVGGTGDLLRYVDSRYAGNPNGGDLDVAWGGGIDPYLELQKKKYLAKYDPPADVLSKIPASVGGVPMYDPSHEWFGTAISTFGICANKRVVQAMHLPQAKKWADLCRPELFGWVGSGDPRKTGSIHMAFEMILQAYGWDQGWSVITRLAANTRNFNANSSTTAKEAALGDTAYAMAIDFYALMQVGREGPQNMAFIQPPEAITLNPDSVGIFRGAPHRALAERFVQYLLSEEGQSLWMIPRGKAGGPVEYSIERMSIIPDLYRKLQQLTVVSINPFELPVAFRYDPAKGSARWQLVNDLFGACIIDVHRELIATWQTMIDRQQTENSALQTELGRLPITEQDATDLAAGKWKDPLLRARKSVEWQRWAREKFRRIASVSK